MNVSIYKVCLYPSSQVIFPAPHTGQLIGTGELGQFLALRWIRLLEKGLESATDPKPWESLPDACRKILRVIFVLIGRTDNLCKLSGFPLFWHLSVHQTGADPGWVEVPQKIRTQMFTGHLHHAQHRHVYILYKEAGYGLHLQRVSSLVRKIKQMKQQIN